MKEIKKEKIEYVTVYQAIDGTEFSSKEECLKYDNTAEAVLLSRYKKMIVLEGTEENIFKFGSYDNIINFIKVENDKDIDTVIQLYVINYNSMKDNIDVLSKKREILEKAAKCDDVVIISRGYDYDNFYIMNSLNGYIDELKRSIHKNE